MAKSTAKDKGSKEDRNKQERDQLAEAIKSTEDLIKYNKEEIKAHKDQIKHSTDEVERYTKINTGHEADLKTKKAKLKKLL